jgi:membrane-anchored protein YejM (alkaline phosphatase superfamily)
MCFLRRSLKAVDDMVGDLVAKLDALGQLDNTYIVYTSDNGFQLGQHGLNYEKFTPFGKVSCCLGNVVTHSCLVLEQPLLPVLLARSPQTLE